MKLQTRTFTALDVLQVVPLRFFDLFPDDVRQYGVPDLSGRCGCGVSAGGDSAVLDIPCAVGLDVYSRYSL